MDPIKNAGVNDYAMTMPQQNEVQQLPEENYSSMPMVYDPTLEEKKESASSGLALKALGAIGLAGLAMWGGYALGSRSLKTAKEAKDAAIKTAEEAVSKAEKLEKNINKAYDIAENGHNRRFFNQNELRSDIKKALKPEEAEVKKTEEAVTEGAKKGEGTAKPEGKSESGEK